MEYSIGKLKGESTYEASLRRYANRYGHLREAMQRYHLLLKKGHTDKNAATYAFFQEVLGA